MFSRDYIAGLVDGEGCIFVQRMIKARAQYYVWARVNMTDRSFIQALAAQFGGSVITHAKSKKNPRHKDAYEFSLYGRKAAEFLRWIGPALVIKREQAKLAIAVQDHIELHKGKIAAGCYDETQVAEIMQYRETLRLRIKELKHLDSGSSIVNVDEFGETPMPGSEESAEGQPRAKQEMASPGACNEQGSTPKGKVCSGLHGNMQSAAEMTAPGMAA